MNGLKEVYICDPEKCKTCGKRSCHTLCFHTLYKGHRARGIKRFIYWLMYMRKELREVKTWHI